MQILIRCVGDLSRTSRDFEDRAQLSVGVGAHGANLVGLSLIVKLWWSRHG